jgi:hypothetical protein
MDYIRRFYQESRLSPEVQNTTMDMVKKTCNTSECALANDEIIPGRKRSRRKEV